MTRPYVVKVCFPRGIIGAELSLRKSEFSIPRLDIDGEVLPEGGLRLGYDFDVRNGKDAALLDAVQIGLPCDADYVSGVRA
jgi:hypothetical protein